MGKQEPLMKWQDGNNEMQEGRREKNESAFPATTGDLEM